MVVEIPVEFRGGGPVTISIAFDVAKLLEGVDLSRDESSTHSRPADALAVRLKKRAAGAFRVVKVSNDIFQPVTPNRRKVARQHPIRVHAEAPLRPAQIPEPVTPIHPRTVFPLKSQPRNQPVKARNREPANVRRQRDRLILRAWLELQPERGTRGKHRCGIQQHERNNESENKRVHFKKNESANSGDERPFCKVTKPLSIGISPQQH